MYTQTHLHGGHTVSSRNELLDVARKVMRRVNLCSKHAPPDHVLSTVTSYDELELSLEAFFRSHALVPGGGGRRRASSSLPSAKL